MVKKGQLNLALILGAAALGFIILTSMKKPEQTAEEQAISGTPIIIGGLEPPEDQPSDLEKQVQELGESLQSIKKQTAFVGEALGAVEETGGFFSKVGGGIGFEPAPQPLVSPGFSQAQQRKELSPLQNIAVGTLDFATFGILNRDFAGQVIEKGERFGARFRKTEIARRLGGTKTVPQISAIRKTLPVNLAPIGTGTAISRARTAAVGQSRVIPKGAIGQTTTGAFIFA